MNVSKLDIPLMYINRIYLANDSSWSHKTPTTWNSGAIVTVIEILALIGILLFVAFYFYTQTVTI